MSKLKLILEFLAKVRRSGDLTFLGIWMLLSRLFFFSSIFVLLTFISFDLKCGRGMAAAMATSLPIGPSKWLACREPVWARRF